MNTLPRCHNPGGRNEMRAIVVQGISKPHLRIQKALDFGKKFRGLPLKVPAILYVKINSNLIDRLGRLDGAALSMIQRYIVPSCG